MTENPTDYDLIQDSRILGVETILSNAAEPPSGGEFSYPVVGQAVSSSMWQWITRGQGDGIIEVGGWPYRLTDLDNASNTGTLTVSTVTGTANAVVAGFFHQLSESMTLSFPMPSSGTVTYHVCLTHDPREENTADGPVSVQVYSGTPPTTFSRTHVVLYTVRRSANQLLTDATVERFRPRVAPVLVVASEDHLGDPKQRLWGTLAVAHQTREWFMAMGSDADVGGPTEWRNLTSPEWTQSTSTAHVWAGHGERPAWRRRGDIIELKGRVRQSSGSAYSPSNAGYTLISNSPTFNNGPLLGGADSNSNPVRRNSVNSDGRPTFIPVGSSASWIDLTGYFYYWK